MSVSATALTQSVHAVVQAACLTPNTMLSGPLTPVITKLTGAVAGLLSPLAGLIAVVLILIGIVSVATSRASTFWKKAGVVLIVVPAFVLALVVINTLTNGIITGVQC